MPTIYGESIVIRILDNYNIKKDIKNLGFSKNIYNHLEDMCLLNQGLVLITGPTGSGKSTTLYSLINRLNNGSKKIITIEDPVEYKIEEIQQIEINEDLGLSFDTVLKNILRQDPDVILIGEIRDTKSLSIALQASLTGHLVLASIHANNSIETLSRLIDLKSDYYLLASCLKYIVSQRLVLNICKHCNNIGCIKCSFRGLLGRSSIAEVLKVDKNISSMILKNENIDSIKTYIYKSSFRTIFDDGKEKIKNMETTLDEVYKVIDSDEI